MAAEESIDGIDGIDGILECLHGVCADKDGLRHTNLVANIMKRLKKRRGRWACSPAGPAATDWWGRSCWSCTNGGRPRRRRTTTWRARGRPPGRDRRPKQ